MVWYLQLSQAHGQADKRGSTTAKGVGQPRRSSGGLDIAGKRTMAG